MDVFPADTDIRTLDPLWYRNQMSIVSQEPTLFACSIKDNIAYGKATATEEEVGVYQIIKP